VSLVSDNLITVSLHVYIYVSIEILSQHSDMYTQHTPRQGNNLRTLQQARTINVFGHT